MISKNEPRSTQFLHGYGGLMYAVPAYRLEFGLANPSASNPPNP